VVKEEGGRQDKKRVKVEEEGGREGER